MAAAAGLDADAQPVANVSAAIITSIQNGDDAVLVARLLDKEPELLLMGVASEVLQWSMLTWAASYGRMGVLRLLLQRGEACCNR